MGETSPGRLERVLRPKSLAVFGGGPAAQVVRQCRKMGFTGEIWPVHPKRLEVEGLRAYRCLADLPAAPDAAFVGVNRFATIEIIKELAAAGAGGAVCYASGFREVVSPDGEGLALEQRLLEAAGAMPILGPNCYGLINYADGALLWPDQQGGRRLAPGETGAAILMQSSNIAINVTMQTRGLPIAFMVTAGNQAMIRLTDIAADLLDDPRVTCLGLHLEGVGDAAALEALALKARKLKKPIVTIKVGRSAQAQAATLSHTASLAGGDAATEALLRRLGVARVDSLTALIESLKLLHCGGPLSGFELASMSCSGGEASVIADAAVGARVRFSPFTTAAQARVEKALGPLVAVANPLDYQTYVWNDAPAMTETFAGVLSSGADLSLLVLDYPRSDLCDSADWLTAEASFVAAVKAENRRAAIVASLPENMPGERAGSLIAQGIAPLQGLNDAIAAAEAAALIGEAWSKPFPPPLLPTSLARGVARLLDEAEGKVALCAYGVEVPAGRRVTTPDAAVQAAEALGFPVALKALGVAHKTERGAVVLNLKDAETVRRQAETLHHLGDGLYVETMVEGALVELIVGVSRDPVAGLLMTLGAGGVLVELLADSVSFLLPPAPGEVADALAALRTAPLLTGYRGRPKADVAAAVAAIEAIARFAIETGPRLIELDVNPLMVRAAGCGAVAADVLIRRVEA